jgi:uncharacterized protein (TIGR02246 family)
MPVSKLTLLPLIAFTLLTFPAHAEDSCGSAADETAVAQTIRTMYAAAVKDDYALFNKVIAPDFYIFDGGHEFKGDAIMDLMKKLHAEGKVYVWTVNDPQVHIVCRSKPEVAWITYVNRGSLTSDGVTTPLEWLESAVLEKQDNQWRIRFFHSTRVPPPPAK